MGADTASRNKERAAKTEELMSNIMTGGEISKKREAELQQAANYGRGIQFVESGSVKGLTQKDGSPVPITGKSASDYRGRIVASTPTLREVGGDIVRATFGGQAKDPSYLRTTTTAPGTTTDTFKQYTPKPQKIKGIVPTMMEKGGTPGMMFIKALSEAMSPKKKTVDTNIGGSLLGEQTTGSTDTILGNSVIK